MLAFKYRENYPAHLCFAIQARPGSSGTVIYACAGDCYILRISFKIHVSIDKFHSVTWGFLGE